jgi:hypothetical protein
MGETSGALSGLVAREYKVMLIANQFLGDEQARSNAVRRCWESFTSSAKATGVVDEGEPRLGSSKKQRHVRFYDTKAWAFYRRAGFILRLRRPISSNGEWDVTLKFRSGDWIRADAQAFRSKTDEKAKFEEDIKASPAGADFQFVPLFSRSADAELNDPPSTVGDALSLFERLDEDQLPVRSAGLSRVRNFEAREEVYEGMELVLSDRVRAECAIILWSTEVGNPDEAVAEFSVRYEFDDQSRSPQIATRAWNAFSAICGDVKWADPTGPTKTAFVYR